MIDPRVVQAQEMIRLFDRQRTVTIESYVALRYLRQELEQLMDRLDRQCVPLADELKALGIDDLAGLGASRGIR